MIFLKPYSDESENIFAGFLVDFRNVHHGSVSFDEARMTNPLKPITQKPLQGFPYVFANSVEP